MNIYLTAELMQTKSLIDTKFLFIEDKPSFIADCNKQNIIDRGIKEEGVFYYWSGGEWEEIYAEDVSSFQEMIKCGYINTPNIYISNEFKVLATAYVDNVEGGAILYKILNQGENRGLFKKNDNNKWKRKMTPEETFTLCQINEKMKGNIYKEILKDIVKNKY